MAEERRITGAPEVVVLKAKLKNDQLSIKAEERYGFTDDTNEVESYDKEFKRVAHPDLIEAFADLAPHFVEICNIDKEKADTVIVTGYHAKELHGDAPQIRITGKIRSVENQWIGISTPLISTETTAYKKAKALYAAIVTCEKEVLQYILVGKSADQSEWTLFTQASAARPAAAN